MLLEPPGCLYMTSDVSGVFCRELQLVSDGDELRLNPCQALGGVQSPVEGGIVENRFPGVCKELHVCPVSCKFFHK